MQKSSSFVLENVITESYLSELINNPLENIIAKNPFVYLEELIKKNSDSDLFYK